MTTGLLTPTHIAILLVVVLLILGPTKLPAMGRSLGRAMREFRDGITGREHSPAEMPPPSPAAVAAVPPPAAVSAPITQEAGSADASASDERA